MALKIGVFDSGIGGLTVLAELRKCLGYIDYIYLGDTAHLPYGAKSPEQIERLSIDCANLLKARGVDAIVVACNTAASWALPAIRQIMGPLPVFGVVEPGMAAALEALPSLASHGLNPPPILVLATRATVNSRAYSLILNQVLQTSLLANGHLSSVPIFEQACPLLVPMIEEGWIDHPILHQTLAEYLAPYVTKTPGVALLGCTHYPWIHTAVEKALPGWKVVNSARAIVAALEKSEWLKKQKRQSTLGKVEWIFTDPQAVPKFALKWLDHHFAQQSRFSESYFEPCNPKVPF